MRTKLFAGLVALGACATQVTEPADPAPVATPATSLSVDPGPERAGGPAVHSDAKMYAAHSCEVACGEFADCMGRRPQSALLAIARVEMSCLRRCLASRANQASLSKCMGTGGGCPTALSCFEKAWPSLDEPAPIDPGSGSPTAAQSRMASCTHLSKAMEQCFPTLANENWVEACMQVAADEQEMLERWADCIQEDDCESIAECSPR
jgi:hypothetical protein